MCRPCYGALYYKENAERIKVQSRAQGLRARFGVSLAEYDKLHAAQDGVCAICGNPRGVRSLAIDHDHRTGLIRGLLCWFCNLGLGAFKDDPSLLLSAVQYLER